jgi:ketosteroid isomerase-like protein
MSQDNLELVRTYFEAANRREVDAVADFLAPEIEFHLAGVFPDLEPAYIGREAVRGFLEQFGDPWEELSVEPETLMELDSRVLVLLHFHAKGRDGIEVVLPLGQVWTLQDGKAVRMDAYPDHRQALEAVGLSESDKPVS